MYRLIAVGALVLVVLALIWAGSQPLVVWATAQQKALQGDLASALRAVRSGEAWAVATMIGLCGLYGVVHAVGPGHGKMLIGGAAVASHHTARRMAGLGVAASLAQGLTAILIVYGGLGLFAATSQTLIGLSETWLTAASYAAIGLVGVWLLWRGGRLAMRLAKDDRHRKLDHRHHDHDHSHSHSSCGAGCRHAPTPQEADAVTSWRDALALIVSIGMRPCSGAMIVLVLSWSFGTLAVGVASVFAMALGTGIVVAAVAFAAVGARDSGGLTQSGPLGQWSFAAAQLCIGAAILIVSAAMAAAALDQGDRPHPLMQSSAPGHHG